ncbi:hypothetical protein [Acinetobacter sp. XH1639]|uniref:hypothetical protein n=1 Tax=Acinetobacter sp. XH1639 TaxID=3157368 RepID=UPI0032B3B1A5
MHKYLKIRTTLPFVYLCNKAPLNTKNTDFYQNTAAKTGYLLPFDYAPKREAIDIVNATSMQTFQKLALFNQLSK